MVEWSLFGTGGPRRYDIESPASVHTRHIKAGNLSLGLLSSQALEGMKDHTSRGIFDKSNIIVMRCRLENQSYQIFI